VHTLSPAAAQTAAGPGFAAGWAPRPCAGRLVVQLAEPVSRYGAATGHGSDRAGIGLLIGIPDAVSAGARVLLAAGTS